MTELCFHGCGQPATHTTKTSRATGGPIHQCSKSANACPAVKARKSARVSAHSVEQQQITKQKRAQTNIEKYGSAVSIMGTAIQEKRRQTMLERYGVEQPTLNKEIAAKVSMSVKQSYINDPYLTQKQTAARKEKYGDDLLVPVAKNRARQLASGRWVDPALRTPWAQYKFRVRYLTSKTYKQHKDIINPNDLPIGRCDYQVDHIYSIRHGFENNVEPEALASIHNLRLMWHSDNKSKHTRSDQTLEQLLEAVKKGSTSE